MKKYFPSSELMKQITTPFVPKEIVNKYEGKEIKRLYIQEGEMPARKPKIIEASNTTLPCP